MKEHSLYRGQVTLKFDEGAHAYYVTDKEHELFNEPIPGVTSISGMAPKNMTEWASRMCAEAFNDQVTVGEVMTVERIPEIQGIIQNASNTMRDDAAAVGSEVHLYIERYIKHLLTPDSKPPRQFGFETDESSVVRSIAAFHDWIDGEDIEFVSTEQKVYHRDLQYAGTMDLDCIISGGRVIVDFKTGAYPSGNHFTQLAGYVLAYEREHGRTFNGAALVMLPRTTGRLRVIYINRTQLDDACVYFGQCHLFKEATSFYKGAVKRWRKGIRYF